MGGVWFQRTLCGREGSSPHEAILPFLHFNPSMPMVLSEGSPSRGNVLKAKPLFLTSFHSRGFFCPYPLSHLLSASSGPRQRWAYFCQDPVTPLADDSFL